MKRALLILLLLALCPFLTGCGGGQEIESCLFVLSMAVDPAPDGNLTVTVKAQNRNGEWFTMTGSELKARCFCHEIDHLDGTLYTSKASKMLDPDELDED